MDSKRRKTGDQDVSALRLASRQKYLAEREAQQLALLRRQVAEEAEEEARLGNKLSERERAEFKKNRQTLELAEARNAIDDSRLNSGFHFQTDSENPLLADTKSKNEVLHRRHKDANDSRTEYAQWEADQVSKSKSQARVGTFDRVDESEYEFVFNPDTEVKFKLDDATRVDPTKVALQAQLDAAEKKVSNIQEQRESLPVYKYKDEIIDALRVHNVLLILGETGSGKTTQIPQFLMSMLENDEETKSKKVVCTQPRRVAAMSIAQRVAEEAGTRLGKKVGYKVRFDSKVHEQETKLIYCTDGILLREAIASPDLSDYGAIIIDEAHERTLATDILLGLLKELILVRPELKIIISSATMSAQTFSDFFYQCPIFSIPGRTFPVEVMYSVQPEANYLSACLSTIWTIHLARAGLPGDILVFLTGEDEILYCAESLEETAKKLGNRAPPLEVRMIYSALPSDEQAKIFIPASPGSRKVVLSTNISETSLTIDGITDVLDPGYEKQDSWDAVRGVQSLSIVPISKASANQRAGRAGRNQPGRCFRLYTKASYWNELPAAQTPSIQRSNLLDICLLLKSLGVHDLIHFHWIDPPSTAGVIRSLELLYGLGCLDSTGALTRQGRKLSELPIDPLLGKAILAASEGNCVEEVIKIIAMLGECHALWIRPKDKKIEADNMRANFTSQEGGDFLTLLNVYTQAEENEWDYMWSKQSFLQQRSLNRAADVTRQLDQLCDKVEVEHSSCGPSDHVAIRRALCAGLFPNAARLARDGQSYNTLTGSQNVWIHPSSVLSQVQQKPKWVIYYEIASTTKDYMRNVMPIEPEWLTEVAPHFHKAETIAKFGVDRKMGKAPSNTLQERSKTSAGHNTTMKTNMPKGGAAVYGSAKPK
jgi:pre-mRNA-splicing factor ATP-dependent RNA helicase DHX16